jgi:hypothetical protein
MASSLGIGKFAENIDDKTGKVVSSFHLNPNLAGAGSIYTSMMNSKAFSHKADHLFNKIEKKLEKGKDIKESLIKKVTKYADKQEEIIKK